MASQNFGCQLFEKLHECQNFLTKFVFFSDIQNKVKIYIREMEDFKLFLLDSAINWINWQETRNVANAG